MKEVRSEDDAFFIGELLLESLLLVNDLIIVVEGVICLQNVQALLFLIIHRHAILLRGVNVGQTTVTNCKLLIRFDVL